MAAVVAMALTELDAQIRFEDVTAKSGLRFELRNGAAGRYHLVELMTGGVAAFDFDSDGCTDVFFANGASLPGLQKTTPSFSNRLFRNQCDGTFADVTTAAGLTGSGFSMGAATGDFDADGFPDLFVTGVNQYKLYRNLGNGKFTDVTLKARLNGKRWSVAGAWLDYDKDGDLDLFVVNYVVWNPATEPRCGPPDNRLYCHPDNYAGTPNELWRNNGDGTFTDVSAASGISSHTGKGMSAAVADYDGDGYPDIYVANDSMRAFLFHNKGNGAFEETGIESGVALRADGSPIAGMGVDFQDLDGDGRPDVFVSGMVNDTFLFFRNEPGGFADWTDRSGLSLATRQLTGWGLGAVDLDNDNHRDLFLAISHFPNIRRYLGQTSEQSNRVLRNGGNGKFEDVSANAGLKEAALWRGTAFADFDNDGRLDVVVSALNSPARLFRNVTQTEMAVLRVHAPSGTQVRVTYPDGKTRSAYISTANGYASSSEPIARFAAALGTELQIEMTLSNGRKVKRIAKAGDGVLRISSKDP